MFKVIQVISNNLICNNLILVTIKIIRKNSCQECNLAHFIWLKTTTRKSFGKMFNPQTEDIIQVRIKWTRFTLIIKMITTITCMMMAYLIMVMVLITSEIKLLSNRTFRPLISSQCNQLMGSQIHSSSSTQLQPHLPNSKGV